MITLADINQYAIINNIDSSTDIFLILSKMNEGYSKPTDTVPQVPKSDSVPTVPPKKVEYTVGDVLDLFSEK